MRILLLEWPKLVVLVDLFTLKLKPGLKDKSTILRIIGLFFAFTHWKHPVRIGRWQKYTLFKNSSEKKVTPKFGEVKLLGTLICFDHGEAWRASDSETTGWMFECFNYSCVILYL